MSDKKRIIIIGSGGWAKNHVLAVQDAEGMTLAGIVGHSNAAKLQELEKEFKIPTSLNAEEMIKEIKPDIIDIACNPHYRLEGIRLACQYGIKVVNVEKPLALTLADAKEIQNLCNEHHIKLTVNHQKKVMPGWRDAEQVLAKGDLGKIELMRAFCQGNLLEQGTHLVDMALFFNQYSLPEWVIAQVGELQGLDKPQASAPDMALAELCLKNGVRILFEIGTIGPPVDDKNVKWYNMGIEVYGEKGKIKATLNNDCQIQYYDGSPSKTIRTIWGEDFHEGLVNHFNNLLDYADGKKEHISKLNNSMLSFQVIMGIYQSALSHSKVIIPDQLQDDPATDLMNYYKGREK